LHDNESQGLINNNAAPLKTDASGALDPCYIQLSLQMAL